jgi:hypothetical protein
MATVDLKLGRAQEHLDALDVEIGRYFAGKLYVPLREYNPQGDRLSGLAVTQNPPAYLALLIGDYLHNARAALDYLAWQLVLANGNTPTAKTKFPIFKHPRSHKKRASRIAIQPGVAAPVLALIEALQPYHANDPALDPLWVLNELANIDKHRTLHTTTVWVSDSERFDLACPGYDTPLPTFRFRHRPRLPEVEVEIETALSVALTEPAHLQGGPIMRLLGETLKALREDVLPRFEPFLDQPTD